MRFLAAILLLVSTVYCWGGYSTRTAEALSTLDRNLRNRSRYIDERQAKIDSLRSTVDPASPDPQLILQIVNLYRGFENDSALYYLEEGLGSGKELPPRFLWKRAALLPLAGMFEEAEKTFSKVDSTGLSGDDLASYLEAGRQMHRYAADFYVRDPERHASHVFSSLEFQKRNIETMDHDNDWYKYNEAEFCASTGRLPMAKILFEELLAESDDLTLQAKCAHHLALLSKLEDRDDDHVYYLALSADADVRSATREVLSLQELGAVMEEAGDTHRAYNYLSNALRNAVECGAPVRMIDSAISLPLIEDAYMRKMQHNQTATYIVLAVFVLMTMILIAMMIVLRRRMNRLRQLQERLRKESDARQIYISRFLQLCSIYMDKLNSFSTMVNRKLATGQADELYSLTKSGKYVEELNADFFDVFDNMFLHIYPTFYQEVNALLRPDSQIELEDGEQLNTDLRILAFMRLGITESGRIAQMLNYSLNTIYSYRNRLKNRAINKESFENDVMKIPPAI